MLWNFLVRLLSRSAPPQDPGRQNRVEPRIDANETRRRRSEIIARHGPWTAHNIHLGEGVYTIQPEIHGDEIKLRRVVQVVADATGRRLDQLRVMDLACLEGLYAMEFARHGSDVVAIEGRETNIAKARFAAEALGLANVTFLRDDVRNFSRASHGAFDVVLCLGILYHLDSPDVFRFLERISQACTRVAVFDTHVGEGDGESRTYRERTYWGQSYVEHRPGAGPGEKERALWASLDNEKSFWPNRPSLVAAIADAGFSSVYECLVPPEPGRVAGRVTLLALKGEAVSLACAPQLATFPGAAARDFDRA